MVVTQEELIRQIAGWKEQDIAAVRTIFKTAETVIFDYLSSAGPSESVTIKLLDGISLECSYVPPKVIHTFDEIACGAKIWTKAKVTRYYNRKLNGYFKPAAALPVGTAAPPVSKK